MKVLMLCVSLVAIAAFLSSCGSVGTSFDHGNLTHLTIEKTTRQEAVTLIGEPRETNRILDEDGDFELLSYLYGKGAFGGPKVRSLSIELKDGVLNGYTYVSTFAEDSISYDFGAFESLEIGSSTKEDALKALGKPTGQGLCPSQLLGCGSEGSSEVWVWQNILAAPKDELRGKLITISFDKSAVVSDIVAVDEVL